MSSVYHGVNCLARVHSAGPGPESGTWPTGPEGPLGYRPKPGRIRSELRTNLIGTDMTTFAVIVGSWRIGRVQLPASK